VLPTPAIQTHDPAIYQTRQIVHAHEIDKTGSVPGEHFLYEGEVQFLDQQQLDTYKALIGDGKSRVTVSKELSESDFGKGGKTMVSISLTCDQSYQTLNGAITIADQLATYWVDQHHNNLRQFLYQKGLLK
jgi:hypothetical protein